MCSVMEINTWVLEPDLGLNSGLACQLWVLGMMLTFLGLQFPEEKEDDNFYLVEMF